MKVHPADAGLVLGNRDTEANAVSARNRAMKFLRISSSR